MSGDDYSRRQAVKDAAYRAEYEVWLKTLSPVERAKLKAAGLDEPLLAVNGNCHGDHDLADSPLASETPDILGEVDDCLAGENFGRASETHGKPREGGDGPGAVKDNPEAVWEVMRRLIGELMIQRNTKLALECLALVSGVSFLGDSMTDIARRHGVTRAAVSKRCCEMTEKLNMLPSRAMRTLTARKAYAHARNRHLRDHE